MKNLLLLVLFFACLGNSIAQNSNTDPAKIRQQMAKIRQTTNWDDPAAAKKANEEIRKLAKQLSGSNTTFQFPGQKTSKSDSVVSSGFEVKTAATKGNVVAIADRFYKRSYKVLDAISKSKFDEDFASAKKENFSIEAVRKLTSTGGVLLTMGNDHLIACVYLAAAVKAFPTDTLSVNNFGAYLRMIDSTAISITVLLYANELFSESPIILSQLGHSYFELNDLVKAEYFFKQALKIDPGFGQAHSALCDLYIKQNRLQDAFIELLAGVKGMGCSYASASGNFNYLQQQAEDSDTKDEFWDETKKQMDPAEALAPLVPTLDRLKLPDLKTSDKFEAWTESGGYMHAVQAYSSFHSQLMAFAKDFSEIHKEIPVLPPNTVLRDYPNERMALDILTELFFKESEEIAKDYHKSADEILQRASDIKEDYLKNLEQYSKNYASCFEGCGADEYCMKECHRKYCQQECPNANKCNEHLQDQYKNFRMAFSQLQSDQIKLLDDFYGFVDPWFAKIPSPYWSKIYAYEIHRVALSIIGNCLGAYPQVFPFGAHNDCGTDCSVFATPTPLPDANMDKKDPKGNECPNIGKVKISILICELGLDCESIEFGCTEGISASIKRNFKKKTTTGFLGVGVKGDAGFIGASFKAGYQVTVTDNNEIEDGGAKVEASVSVGAGPAKTSATTTGSYSVMTGAKSSVSYSFTGKAK